MSEPTALFVLTVAPVACGSQASSEEASWDQFRVPVLVYGHVDLIYSNASRISQSEFFELRRKIPDRENHHSKIKLGFPGDLHHQNIFRSHR